MALPSHRNPREPQPECCELCGLEIGGIHLSRSEAEGLEGVAICDVTPNCRTVRAGDPDGIGELSRPHSSIGNSRVFDVGSNCGCASPENLNTPPVVTVAACPGRMTVSWVPEGSEVSFDVQRQAAGGAWSFVYTAGAAETLWEDPFAFIHSVQYCYRVRGEYADGTFSAWSNTDCAIAVSGTAEVPDTPRQIFGSACELFWDIRLQGISEGDGNPVDPIIDHSTAGIRPGLQFTVDKQPLLVVDGPNCLPVWRYDGVDDVTTFNSPAYLSGEKYSIFMVSAIRAEETADVFFLNRVNGVSEIRWREPLKQFYIRNESYYFPTITMSQGPMHSFANVRYGTSGDMITSVDGVEEDSGGPTSADEFAQWGHFANQPGFGGYGAIDLRMLAFVNYAADAAERQKMYDYMDFMISGGWVP